eukprot:2686014-Prymnesium_polylepis.1
MLQRFVVELGEHGLLVMLDLHAMEAGKWPDSGKAGLLRRADLKKVFNPSCSLLIPTVALSDAHRGATLGGESAG